jgi:hypothetical protein
MSGVVSGQSREAGLSEVIGFILIIGLIVMLASLYLVYVVPAQGREGEIQHMNEVKEEFVTYKTGLDSLFTNDKVDSTIGNTFNLGTSGGYTQGTFSFLPLMSPVGSGGTLSIDPVGPGQRVTENETLEITSQSLIFNNSANSVVDFQWGSPVTVNNTPGHVYVNISNIPGATYRNKNGVYGWTVNTTSWAATINLTPQTTFYQQYKACTITGNCASSPSCPSPSPNGSLIDLTTSCLVPMNIFNYTQSDLTISVIKNNISTTQNYPVYRNIQFDQTQPYTIDLMNSAYGLSSVIQSGQQISLTPFDSTATASLAKGNISYNFIAMNPYTMSPIPLGSLEYQAQNNYWVTQKYYYQMGGVFLEQVDGNTTYKLPPEITFAKDQQNPDILIVNINALSLDPNIPSNHGTVGGSSSVQLKTTLTNSTPLPFVPGTANTKWITIGLNTTDDKARVMWHDYFDYTARVAQVPQTNYQVGYNGKIAWIKLCGSDCSVSPTDYTINVIASNATYKTTVHGIGGF